MSQFIESIRVEHGKMVNLQYHQRRLNRTFEIYFKGSNPHDLSALENNLPDSRHKLRVVYDDDKISHELKPYLLPSTRNLKLIHTDVISYEFKLLDRSELNLLFAKRGSADDIAIIKNGLLTDSHYANFALQKEGKWFTPDTPLLKGTKRAQLIDIGLLEPLEVRYESLQDFSKVCLINAMIDLEEVVISFV